MNFNSNRMPSAPRGRGRGSTPRPAARSNLRNTERDDEAPPASRASAGGHAAVPRAPAASLPPSAPRDGAGADGQSVGGSGNDHDPDRGTDNLDDADEGDILDESGHIVGGRRGVSRRSARRSKDFVDPFEVDPASVSFVT